MENKLRGQSGDDVIRNDLPLIEGGMENLNVNDEGDKGQVAKQMDLLSPQANGESEKGSGRDSGLGENDEASRPTTSSTEASETRSKDFASQASADSGVVTVMSDINTAPPSKEPIEVLPEAEDSPAELRRSDSCSNSPGCNLTHEKPLKSISLSSMPQESPESENNDQAVLSLDDINASIADREEDPDRSSSSLPSVLDRSDDCNISQIDIELETPKTSPVKKCTKFTPNKVGLTKSFRISWDDLEKY